MNLYYIQVNVICILVLVCILAAPYSKRSTTPTRQLTFGLICVLTMFMCLSDILAWTMNGKTFHGARFLLECSNMLYYAMVTWLCFVWFVYVNARVSENEKMSNRAMSLSAIPMIIMSAVIFINPFTYFLFSISADNIYSRENGIILHWVVTWGYIIGATVRVVVSICRAKTKIEKRQLRPLLFFFFFPTLGAILQMIFFGSTVLQCGIVLSVVLIVLSSLLNAISLDSLTGLNNRGALDRYFEERVLNSEGTSLTVYMCDVDNFKKINDVYGHVAGDNALKCVSEILKKACSMCDAPLFLSRYGGDEFVICGVQLDELISEQLEYLIEDALKEINKENRFPFSLGLSIGETTERCSTYCDVEEAIAVADEKMYDIKTKKKVLRN